MYFEYAKYAKYVPGSSSWSEQLHSFFTIIKVGFDSVDAAHMADCTVEHEIIVRTCHSSFSASFGGFIRLGLGQRWRAEELEVFTRPTENVAYVQYV